MTWATNAIEGFEDGGLVPGYWTTSGTAPAVVNTKSHSGTYSCEFNPAADYCGMYVNTSNDLGLLVAYVWFDSLPSNDMTVMQVGQISGTDHRVFIAINAATNKWRLGERINGGAVAYGADGPAAATGEWIQLSLGPHSSDASYHYIDGYVGTTALPQCQTATDTGGALGTLIFGNRNELGNSVETITWYLDDILYFLSVVTPPTAPMDEYSIVRLKPTADGTHSTAASFTDDAANSPPASVYDRLDETPPSTGDTDYIEQTTLGAGDYLEVSFEDLPSSAATIFGVHTRISRRNNSGLAISALNAKLVSGASSWTLLSDNFIAASWGFDVTATKSSGESDWTAAEVNALLGRVGFSFDATPVPQCGYFCLQVAYTGGFGWWGWGVNESGAWADHG